MGLDVAVVTGMGDGRNVVNVLSSDVVIACRGGAGTLSEAALAVKTGCPLILLAWRPTEVPDQLTGPLVTQSSSVSDAIEEAKRRLDA